MSHRKEDWNLYSTVVRSPDFVGMMYTSRQLFAKKCNRLQKRNGFYLFVYKIIWLKNFLAWEEKHFDVSNLFSGRRTTLRFFGAFSVQFMWNIYQVGAPLLWSTLLQVYPIIGFLFVCCVFVLVVYFMRACVCVTVCVVCLSVCLSLSVCAFERLYVWAFVFLACGVFCCCCFCFVCCCCCLFVQNKVITPELPTSVFARFSGISVALVTSGSV